MADMLEPHPIAEILPPMPPNEFAALAGNIKTEGLIEPITLYDGKILDGRHRYAACLAVDVSPVFQQYEGADPAGFVLSKNLHRRHLKKADQKRAAAELLTLQPERSSNSIAKAFGLSPHTVEAIREELPDPEPVESNLQSANYDFGTTEDGEVVTIEVAPAVVPVVAPAERVEKSGRKARGRRPLPAKVKKERRQQRLSKASSLERDEWANSVANHVKSDPDRNCEALIMLLSGYDGMFQQKLTVQRRQEFVGRFAKAMGVGITLL